MSIPARDDMVVPGGPDACRRHRNGRAGDGPQPGDWRRSGNVRRKWRDGTWLKLLHRYHDATNARRLDDLDDIFAKDFINFAAGFEPVKSLAAMKKLIQELLLAFPDWHVTVEDMFAQDNKVVTRWSLAATHLAPYHDIPATGLKIRAEGIHIDHIVADKIAKRWACNNFAEVFNKLRAHAAT
jgi:steroid delta-isomerase-like uncharacterized protein